MKLPGVLQNLRRGSNDDDEGDDSPRELSFGETPDGRLQSSDKDIRMDMVEELEDNPGAESLALLTTYIGDPDPDVREAIIEVVAEYDEEAIPLLTNVLGGDSRIAREAAVAALALIGGEDVVPALILALKDISVWVREAAVEVLNRFADSDERAKAALAEYAATPAPSLDEPVVSLMEEDIPITLSADGQAPEVKKNAITR